MPIVSEEVNNVLKKKFSLMKLFEKKEITEDEYNKQAQELDLERKNLTSKILEEKEKTNTRVETMPDVKEVKPEVVKRGPKPKVAKEAKVPKERKPSVSAAVIEVLQMKSVKNRDDVVEKVSARFPNVDKKKIYGQMNVLLTAIRKKKQKRFNAYTWDAAAFQLTKKE